jgi:superfamily I DNA/RNA helicase
VGFAGTMHDTVKKPRHKTRREGPMVQPPQYEIVPCHRAAANTLRERSGKLIVARRPNAERTAKTMDWHIPFNRLSPRQRHVLSTITADLGRTHWVRGCAGTGKTLVMTHLVERVASMDPNGTLCFITYTNSLADLVSTGIAPTLEDRVSVMTHTAFLNERHAAKYVILDEVQDISFEDLAKIRSKCERLYVAGDPDQCIYLGRSGEREIASIVGGKQFELVEVHRLTPEIRALAEQVMPGATLVSAESAKDGESFPPQVNELDSEEEEVAWVWARAQQCAAPGKPAAILLPTHDDIYRFASQLAQMLHAPYPPRALWRKNRHPDYDSFNDFWAEHQIPFSYLGGGFGSLPESDDDAHTYIMTYHSSKGLDFESVFLPRLNASRTLVRGTRTSADPQLETRLLYVAITRSRRRLFVSHTESEPHAALQDLDPDILEPFDEDRWNEHLDELGLQDPGDEELWDAELETEHDEDDDTGPSVRDVPF